MKQPLPTHRLSQVSAPSCDVSEEERERVRSSGYQLDERPSGIRRANRDRLSDVAVAISSIPVPLPDGSIGLTWDLIRRGPGGEGVPERLALKALLELSLALGVLHDDTARPSEWRAFGAVCPANVLFTKAGTAHLPPDAKSTLPQPRLYAAPEREKTHALDLALDVYSLGVMLLEILARRELSPEEVRSLEPKSVAGDSLWRAYVSDLLLTIALRATSRAPEYRWPSVAEFAEAVARRAGGRVARREELVALIAMTSARHAADVDRQAVVGSILRQPAAFDIVDLPGISEGSAVTPWETTGTD